MLKQHMLGCYRGLQQNVFNRNSEQLLVPNTKQNPRARRLGLIDDTYGGNSECTLVPSSATVLRLLYRHSKARFVWFKSNT